MKPPLQKIAWLLGMCAMLMLALAPFSSYVAALPFIQSEWKIGNTTAGLVFSAYLAGYAISALLVLPLTDRMPTGRVFLASAIVSVATNILFPLVAFDVLTASLIRFASGIGLVGIYMPGLRLIAAEFPDTGRGASMGMYVTAFYTAHAVSLVATGQLMTVFEWRGAFLALSALSALSIPLTLILTQRRGAASTATSSAGGWLQIGVLSDKVSRAYIAGYSLHAMELYAVRVWLPTLLVSILVARGADVAEAAVTGATVGGFALAAGSVGPVIGGFVSDKAGRAPSAMAIFALSGICSFAIGWIIHAPWPVVVVMSCILGWAVSADSSIYSTAITESANPSQLGSAMAMQAFVGFMGGVLGPIYIGAILDIVPESIRWGVGFSGVALLAIVAVPVLWTVRRRHRT